jgi:hypothetical protein
MMKTGTDGKVIAFPMSGQRQSAYRTHQDTLQQDNSFQPLVGELFFDALRGNVGHAEMIVSQQSSELENGDGVEAETVRKDVSCFDPLLVSSPDKLVQVATDSAWSGASKCHQSTVWLNGAKSRAKSEKTAELTPSSHRALELARLAHLFEAANATQFLPTLKRVSSDHFLLNESPVVPDIKVATCLSGALSPKSAQSSECEPALDPDNGLEPGSKKGRGFEARLTKGPVKFQEIQTTPVGEELVICGAFGGEPNGIFLGTSGLSSPSIAEQIATNVRDAVRSHASAYAPDQIQNFKVIQFALKPESLGYVEVKLMMRGDRIEVQLLLDRPETVQSFRQSTHELSEALSSNGVAVESVVITSVRSLDGSSGAVSLGQEKNEDNTLSFGEHRENAAENSFSEQQRSHHHLDVQKGEIDREVVAVLDKSVNHHLRNGFTV